MKNLTILTTILFALGLFVVPATFATGSTDSEDKQSSQGEYQKDQKGQSQALQSKQAEQGKQFQQQKQSLVLVENLNGAQVLNQQGEKIGKINSVLVDVKTGQVGFVTLTSGGVLGIGGESYIIPFNALKNEMAQGTETDLGMNQLRFTLNKSNQLKRTPEGDIEEALSQEDRSRGIFEHYGVSPYWEDDEREMMDDTEEDQMMND